MKQRKPREDQTRDNDSIRRYEIASDIDGDTVICRVIDNVLSLHEPSDLNYTSPKFQFVFRDHLDLDKFVQKILLASSCSISHHVVKLPVKDEHVNVEIKPDGTAHLIKNEKHSILEKEKEDQGWKSYNDASPLVLKINLKKESVMQLTIKESKFRKNLNEQMGLVKIETVIEIKYGKKMVESVYSQGMVEIDSPQAKRIKHLSPAEKIEATRRFLNDPSNEAQLQHFFAIPKQDLIEVITSMNSGKFTVVKDVMKKAAKKPAKPAKKVARETSRKKASRMKTSKIKKKDEKE